MSDKMSNNNAPVRDEIDLGQLFQLMGYGFKKAFRFFLRVFLYLKKNIITLTVLFVLGIVIGFGLNQVTIEKLKTEVIVKPNLEAKNYLYQVVDEIRANINRNSEIYPEKVEGFDITIEPVGNKGNVDIDIEYIELLEKFQSSSVISDVAISEILNKSSLNHRITFFYNDRKKGQECADKLMEYINSNPYFVKLGKVYKDNANERIKKNEILIGQVDKLIINYSKRLEKNDSQLSDARIVVSNEDRIDVKGLFEMKNNLIRDIEIKKLELINQNEVISIINFGEPQRVKKKFFGKKTVLIPLLLIGVFFIISIIKYLNRKVKEIFLL